MKRKIILISLIIVLVITSIIFVSADKIKNYDSNNKKITISNSGGGKSIESGGNNGGSGISAEYVLINNSDYCSNNCYANILVNLNENYDLYDSLIFKNKNNENISLINAMVNIIDNKGDTVIKNTNKGIYTIQIKAQKNPRQSIDWILSAFGLDLSEWAWWNSWQDWNDDFETAGLINQTLWTNESWACGYHITIGGATVTQDSSTGDGRANLYTYVTALSSSGLYIGDNFLTTNQDFNDGRNYNITFTQNNSIISTFQRVMILDNLNGADYYYPNQFQCNYITPTNYTVLYNFTSNSAKENYTITIRGINVSIYNSTGYINSINVTNWTKWYVGFENKLGQIGDGQEPLTQNIYIYNFTTFGDDLTVQNINPPDTENTNNPIQNLSCNMSVSFSPLQNATLYVYNSTGNMINNSLSLNITGNSNQTDFNYSIPYDDTFNFDCLTCSQDGFCNSSTNTSFTLNTISPSINLNYPTDNTYFNYTNNIYFNYTATDSDGLSTCSLYGNFTGTWTSNYTWTSPVSGSMNYTALNLSDEHYIWNVFCNDTFSNEAYATQNRSVIIDTTKPLIIINSITTTAGSQTISFNSTETDLNLNSCKYSIYNSTGDIDGTNSNVSYTCNSNPHSATTSDYGNFTLRIYAKDFAINENQSEYNFTTSASNGTTIIISSGGGGGTTTRVEAQNYSITSINYLKNLDFSLAKDSVKSRTRNFYITNKGSLPIELTLVCDTTDTNSSTRNISICDYVDFNATTITVSPNENDPYIGTVNVLTPDGSSNGDIYYFNILALNEQSASTELVSKLSISARVSALGTIYKWSYLPDSEKFYPVWIPAFLLGLIGFVTMMVIFKKMPFTGFILGILAFIGLMIIVFLIL